MNRNFYFRKVNNSNMLIFNKLLKSIQDYKAIKKKKRNNRSTKDFR